MKILLFGTGDYYHKYKNWFRVSDIHGLLDNDEKKSGTLLDGHKIYLPKDAVKLSYDCIVILSVHEEAMHRQLQELGVRKEKIYKFSELYKHPELIGEERAVCFWGDGRTLLRITAAEHTDAILVMSHNLDLNGASLVLFYLAQLLVKNGMRVFFASWSDGVLRGKLYEEGIPVIIDENLQMRTQKEIEWTYSFRRIICNTLNYYQFLSDRDFNAKVLWWLHDPILFYRSLDLELLCKIRGNNLSVYAVSSIAEEAFRTYLPDFEVGRLVYGIPDVSVKEQKSERLCFVTIGNVQEYKGQDILIEALKRLGEKNKRQIQVHIVGYKSSAYANVVKKSAEKLGDMVCFQPSVGREEIHRILDEANVLICPSRQDCMPTVTVEAMMHGIPCIVSDTTGTAVYIRHGKNGLVFKSGDVFELAGLIEWCIENRDSLAEMGKRAREVYKNVFSMEVFEKNLMKAVHEAL